MRCLYLVQELAPYFVEGGLGQAARALPAALGRDHGIVHDLFVPYYPWLVTEHGLRTERVCTLPPVTVAGVTCEPAVERLAGWEGPGEVLLLRADEWYDRAGIYRDSHHVEFTDAVARAACFGSCAATWAARQAERPGRAYDLVHANDWQSGAALAHLRTAARRSAEGTAPAVPRLLMNVHSGAYTGAFARTEAAALGLPAEWHDRLPDPRTGPSSLLLLGLLAADAATTGSPAYAAELRSGFAGTPIGDALGRLELTGIVAGVDVRVWDPAARGRLPVPYDARSATAGKAAAKAALRERLELKDEAGAPLLAICGRLVEEKGVDLALAAVSPLVRAGTVQLVVMGYGDNRFHTELAELARSAPTAVHHAPRFDQELAWLEYAAADFTVMPSRVEPCGLNQLVAMAYGTVPLVSSVGGLRDTVTDLTADPARGTGFVFPETTAESVRRTVLTAADWFRNRPAEVRQVRARVMAQDWTWARTARETSALYARVTGLPANGRTTSAQAPQARENALTDTNGQLNHG